MMAALTGGLASQASNASVAASTSTGVDELNKIKLRLCYNGRFQQVSRLIWHTCSVLLGSLVVAADNNQIS